MYLSYWRLKEKPFEIAPDPKFFYLSKNHEEALQRLLFCSKEHRGSFALTGEYGSGKTLLSRVLISELAKDIRCQLALVVNPRLNPREFLEMIWYELGGSKEKGVPDKIHILEELKQILNNNAKASRETIVIIDEAQAIENEEVLDEIRLLMNIQNENELLMNVIFVGQPEFKEKVSKIKQLQSRIQMWFHLTPMDADDTQKYIQHRLQVAGLTHAEIFTPDAHQKIFSLAGGVPRNINNLCNMCLWIGERTQLNKITGETVEMAWQAMNG